MNPSGLVQKNPQNQTSGRFIHNYSSFDGLSRSRVYTARFGEYTPSFVFDGVEKDQISVNSVDRLDSYSLNSPFKGTLRKIKESFAVPKMAILPMNWDRIYVQPANGDDVPRDANCVLLDFPTRFSYFWQQLLAYARSFVVSDDEIDFPRFITAVMRLLVTGEYVYSEGSLLAYCGYHGNAQIEFLQEDPSYDGFFDAAITALFSNISRFKVTFGTPGEAGSYVKTYFGRSGAAPSGVNYNEINNFRDFLSDFRDDPTAVVTEVSNPGATVSSIVTAVKQNVLNRSYVFHLPTTSSLDDDLKDMLPTTLNLSRLLAYQMVCAHFYSNSGVDFLYTAEQYRQYMFSLYNVIYDYPGTFFSWNGMSCPYDYLSGNRLCRMLYYTNNLGYVTVSHSLLADGVNDNPDVYRFAAFSAIFGFRRSLRFVDYFVGSRTRPLAPFNSDVSVNNNKVDVIDVTKRIQGQRFANAVMRTRSKIENYVKSIFGEAPAPDYHNPFFLAREEENVFGDEVQNTGERQVSTQYPSSRTGLMASNSGRYTFTFHNEDNHPCIYLQIISFDIRRHYSRSVDRQMLQVDRYDMFNPDFQYIGDQPVYGIELGFTSAALANNGSVIPPVFGYQGRDMEYKQSFDIALGGAIRRLPGWFMTDSALASTDEQPKINSDFIRSYPSELDRFYLSLTGYSLATYFHFIINTQNNVNAKRAMAVDPQILA